MPQVPGLPIDTPVERPFANPRQFGQGGEAVAQLGFDTEQMAQANAQFEGQLANADRQLKYKQVEIQLKSQIDKVHNDLSKATTVADAQAIADHANGEIQNVIAPFATDKAMSRTLGLYSQQQLVELQHVVNARKATIIQAGDDAANKVFFTDSIKDAVNTKMAGGDAAQSRKQMELKLENSVRVMGTMTPEEASVVMQNWDKQYQSGVVEAYINNPDPGKRQEVIAQLKAGGKGPLDLSSLNQGEINRLYDHAVNTDHNLSIKDEAESLNTTLNIVHDAFSTPQYKDQFDLQKQALDDGEWLKQHGIVTRDGQPDRIMADKLKHMVGAAETDFMQAATKKANEFRDQAFDMFAKGDITGGLNYARQHVDDFRNAKVDYWPQIVNASKSWEAERRAEIRANHQIHNEDLQLQRQQELLDSQETLGKIQLEIQSGRRYTDTELHLMLGTGKGKMRSAEVSAALQTVHSFETDPVNKEYYKAITDSGIEDKAVIGELNVEFGKYLREHPQANDNEKAAFVKHITDSEHIDSINDGINKALEQIEGPKPKGFWSGLFSSDGPTPLEATDQGAPGEKPPGPKPQYKVGDTRQYNGHDYKFNGSNWVLQGTQ